MAAPIRVGAVIYDPKVTVIWGIITEFFADNGVEMECRFYQDYALQADALIAGDVEIAWNSPLAWVDVELRTGGGCRAIAMRDTDRDRVTRILVRRDSGIDAVDALRGRTVAFGATDSPQATLLPTHLLRDHGLVAGADFQPQLHNVMVGQHGDHVGGELDALQSLMAGTADAAAVLDLNWERWSADGTASAEEVVVLASTALFDHCNFTVLDAFPADVERRWLAALFAMSYDNPQHREMMDLEGLRAWLPGRTSGYRQLSAAVAAEDFFGDR